MNFIHDFLTILNFMSGAASSLAMSVLGIPQCSLGDTRGCVG